MTRLFLTLALWLSAATAWGQVDESYWNALTPPQRIEILRQWFLTKPGEIVIPDGEYDFGDKEVKMGFASQPGVPVTIRPKTPGKVKLKSSQYYRRAKYEKDANGKEIVDPATGKLKLVMQKDPVTGEMAPVDRGASSCFIHGYDVIFDGNIFESTCPSFRQSCIIGPGFDPLPTENPQVPRKATFRNNTFLCRAFGPYLWHCDMDTFIFEDNNRIVAANVGIALGRSSGYNAQVVRIVGKNNVIELDWTRSTQHGDVTNPGDGGECGVAVRGGQLYIESSLKIIGRGNDDLSGGPRVCGVADGLAGGSRHSFISVKNLQTQLKPGKSTKVLADIDIQYIGTGAPSTTGKLMVGGTGSAPDGGLLIRKPELAK